MARSVGPRHEDACAHKGGEPYFTMRLISLTTETWKIKIQKLNITHIKRSTKQQKIFTRDTQCELDGN